MVRGGPAGTLRLALQALPSTAVTIARTRTAKASGPPPTRPSASCLLEPGKPRVAYVPLGEISGRALEHHFSLTLYQAASEASPALAAGWLHVPPPSPLASKRSLWEGGGNVGLASIDRNNKATLLFTAPYYTVKSYARVLFLRMVKLQDVS